jgi:hypothetical protein
MNDDILMLAIESLMRAVGQANGVEISTAFKEDKDGRLLQRES